MRLLLGRGADVIAQNNRRSTPLHKASSCSPSAAAVQLLFDCGANPNVRDEKGRTLLQVASKRGYREIERLLSDYLRSHQKSSRYI